MSDAGDASTTVNAGTWDGGLPVVTAAYRSLPERWRSVLWLVEVQRVGPAEAGAILGVSGNGLTQLSLRARAGMQERYLQAQLRGPVAEQCLPVLERLGDYVAASLAPAAMGDIDEHLQRCDACEQRLSDLDDLGAMLGRIAAPMPPTLVAMATTRWKLASNAATVASRARLGVLSFPNSGRKPLAGAALAVLGLGIIGAAVVSGPLLNHGSGLGGIAPAAAAPTEVNRVAAFENANPFLLAGGGIPAAVPTGSATSANPAVPSGSGATASPAGAGGGGAPSAGRGTTAGALPSAPGAPSTTLPKAPLPSVPTATVPLIPTTTLLSPTTVVPTTLPAPLSPLTIPTL